MPGQVHIVDDDERFAAAMARRLRHAGHEVAVYASAEQFLGQLASGSVPGCVLLDVHICQMDGIALQRRLSELRCTLPIIFLSDDVDIPVVVLAIKADGEDFFAKPVSLSDLLRAIERALALNRSAREVRTQSDVIYARIAKIDTA